MEITKEILENLLSQGLSGNQIAKQFNMTGTGLRYHLKKYDLSSNHLSFLDKQKHEIIDGHRFCPKCQTQQPLENYNKRPNGNLQSYCRTCLNNNRYDLLKQRKLQLIQEFGNKCSICGYDKCIAALEFHHINPNEKEFHLGKAQTTNLAKLRKELSKCILVCSNCHKEIHYK